jgi:uncharacterized membrane protein YhdT
MKSEIDDQLTKKEKQVLSAYENPKEHMRKALRLSIQYLIAIALFAFLSVKEKNINYSLVMFGVFAILIVIRLINAKKISEIMPKIIAKYEEEIKRLKEKK